MKKAKYIKETRRIMSEQLTLLDMFDATLSENGKSTHIKFKEYYVPQNSGYTSGTAWFDAADTQTNNKIVFSDIESAIAYNQKLKKQYNDDSIKFRVIKRTVSEVVVYI